jgi:hypothetical protein
MLPFKCLVEGFAEGAALVSPDAFSLTGELDPKTGMVVNSRSRLYNECISGRIFVFPYGRGSSCTSAILAEAIRLQTAPAAIINITVEPILFVGAVVAEYLYERTVPIVSVTREVFEAFRSGDQVQIDTAAGTLLHRSLATRPAD